MTTDSLDLADDGRIRITFNDDTITLKVPKVKEYREIKTSASEANAELRAAAEREREAAEQAASSGVVNAIDTDLSLLWGPVVQKIIDILGDKPAPDLDDLPVWLVDDQAALSSMLVHWRTVPLGRGGVVPPR